MTAPLVPTCPAPPSRTDDRVGFATKADAMMTYLPTLQAALNSLGVYLDALSVGIDADSAAAAQSATAAAAQATAAAVSAAQAAVSAAAPKWVSGTSYNTGMLAFSPANGRIYRRLTTGVSTTDPSLDAVGWVILSAPIEQKDTGTGFDRVPMGWALGDMASQSSDGIILRPQASATPHLIGDAVFQLTSDTTLAIKVRGSDGVVRSGTVTLA